jgi:hypothetical protein
LTVETKTKRPQGRPATGRDDGVARLERDLIKKARVVAFMRDVPIGQVLSELLAAPLDRAYNDLIRAAK